MSDATLTRANDVSYDKIMELLDKLLGATSAGRVNWSWSGDKEYDWNTPSGVVSVTPERISIYNDRGVRLRRFAPDSDSLWRAVSDYYERLRHETLDAILADLEALNAAS